MGLHQADLVKYLDSSKNYFYCFYQSALFYGCRQSDSSLYGALIAAEEQDTYFRGQVSEHDLLPHSKSLKRELWIQVVKSEGHYATIFELYR